MEGEATAVEEKGEAAVGAVGVYHSVLCVKEEFTVVKTEHVATPAAAKPTDEANPAAGAVGVERGAGYHSVQVKEEFRVPRDTVRAEPVATPADEAKLPEVDKAESHEQPADTAQPVGTKRKQEGALRMCRVTLEGGVCPHADNCKYSHDIAEFLRLRPEDLGPRCYQFDTFGKCDTGVACRFGASHIDKLTGQNVTRSAEEGGVLERAHINVLSREVQNALRKNRYHKDFVRAEAYSDKPVKLVDFSNKVYVAPLTTIGNLPFRRILKEFGADITCGEMAVAQNIDVGQPSEWALLRRHPSEDVYGVQVAFGRPDQAVRVGRLINNETQTDFVDLNCGCPIDPVTNKGLGSSLMRKPQRLLDIVSAMTKAFDRSVTVKVRTGWNEPVAHKIIPQLQARNSSGKIAAIMIHGRNRQQRYTKDADWNYVYEAAKAQDPSLPLIPVIGNGDILTYDDWRSHQQLVTDSLDSDKQGLCSCAMIARGAIIKPWLPQEIKEHRTIDISSSERIDMLKRFCNYGFEHWGSDAKGVETTRRFLLEWLSYLCKYVPSAMLLSPQKMQQRPPQYRGRDDMEQLLGSSRAEDWVKISEMLLGPVPPDFRFEGAKHKSSNVYASEHDNEHARG